MALTELKTVFQWYASRYSSVTLLRNRMQVGIFIQIEVVYDINAKQQVKT